MPLTNVSVRKRTPTFLKVAVPLLLKIIFLFDSEIIMLVSFGFIMAGSNEVYLQKIRSRSYLRCTLRPHA
jgi:hypothetical protein